MVSEGVIERAVFALVGLLGGALHFGLISYDRSLDDLPPPPPARDGAHGPPGPAGSSGCPGELEVLVRDDGTVSVACAPSNG